MKKFTDKINESVEERIPTIEELFKKYSSLLQFEEGDSEYLIDKDDFKEAMIEFTKLHLEAALKAASVSAEIENCGNPYDTSDDSKCVSEKSILNAYPLDNIK